MGGDWVPGLPGLWLKDSSKLKKPEVSTYEDGIIGELVFWADGVRKDLVAKNFI